MSRNKSAASQGRISSYFRHEWSTLLVVTVTGVIYNAGMVAGPWFEGQLAQRLCDVIGGSKTLADMISLAAGYTVVIALVQAMRCAKRFYVRRFANNVSRSMKIVLYQNLAHNSTPEIENENIGALMTKAISDVDACAEGMRKFTTEVFDTGVVMLAYLAMLLFYDWRLVLICGVFPPFANLLANKLKKTVSLCAAEYKESTGRLNEETLDRVAGTLVYRTLSCEPARNKSYENRLCDYEKRAVRSGILETTMQPLYQIIATAGVVFIVYFGAKNVMGNGSVRWDIAAFTTFLSCFSKLAVKSSKAAKLFNSVTKAKVSWARIRPLLKEIPDDEQTVKAQAARLAVERLSFAYPGGERILNGISFTADPGQIIGVTGQVACGKSTLGKVFLCEQPYSGSIRFGGMELSEMSDAQRYGAVVYMGHDAELLSDTIEENILLGKNDDAARYLEAVCMDGEVGAMPLGIKTPVGSGGVRLSGGQQARLALARTLCNKKPLIILDDPFAALDRDTEKAVMDNLRAEAFDCTVILISHRLYLFPQLDKVIWMENGTVTQSTHDDLMATNSQYRELYETQAGGETVEQ